MITDELKDAFQFHMRHLATRRPAKHWIDGKPQTHAIQAIASARADVAAGKTRYPAPVKGHAMRAGHDSDKPKSVYVESPESFGLRLVGRVSPEFRRGPFDGRDCEGWITDPYGYVSRDGSGLIYGLVYQLPARKGQSRFVAAYQVGDTDSGALIDFGTIYTSASGAGGTWGSAQDDDDARDAARAADSMAKAAAEAEREYQTAWQAGSRYSDESGDLQAIRQEVRGILAERRALKGTTGYPALCKAIAARVRDLLDDMAERRDKMRELANGMFGDLAFYTGDKDLAAAFNEGAGESVLPC